MKEPSVSAIIVNWNHGPFIEGCLEALLGQDYSALDVMVVDNGSRDGSPARIAACFPGIRLCEFPQNRGFAHAFNWGVRHTVSDWVLSLNPDAVVHEGFLSEMVQTMAGLGSDCRVGAMAPKLLQAADPAILDSTGLFVDRRRRPHDRGQGEPDCGQYNGQVEVFGACGAAALYRRAMLEDLAVDGEYFDEGFFAYYEDADLAWRAQLRGWRCLHVPSAAATHARGRGDTLRRPGRGPKNAVGPRLALRNRYLMTVRNDAGGHFFADLPWILTAEFPRLGYAAVTQPSVLLGLPDLLRAFPRAWRQRRQIQGSRIVDQATIRRWFIPSDRGDLQR